MKDRAGWFGAVMAALLVSHNVADHVVQTDRQASGKAGESDWVGPMTGHVSGYTAVQLAALVGLRRYGVRPSWARLTAGMAFSAATHAVLDRRKPVKWILKVTGSPGFARGMMTIPELLVLTPPPVDGDVVLRGHLQEAEVAAPLHGPHLADQALHHACLAIAAAIIVGRS